MMSDLIAVAISVTAIIGGSCYLLYEHYCRKKAMRELFQRFMRDRFLMEWDYLEAHRAMISKACQKNVKEELRNKD